MQHMPSLTSGCVRSAFWKIGGLKAGIEREVENQKAGLQEPRTKLTAGLNVSREGAEVAVT